MGEPDVQLVQRISHYLSEQAKVPASVIDTISLVFAVCLLDSWAGSSLLSDVTENWVQEVTQTFERLRRPDGGYAKTSEGHASSTYQTFLIMLAYQLLELPLPEPQRAGEFILGQQRDDGGFVEIGVMRRSGTNPTAAAVGALRVLQAQASQELLSSSDKERVASFLTRVQSAEGGYCANTQIPLADLLSTYTALQTLRDIDCWEHVDRIAVLEFVKTLQDPAGGFRAAAWDDTVDVEYSFYGLATLGLLLA
ncbi:MAG: terpene cyclase/mutase family protein [Planctomycetales bacterium]|nr:terpene cyclase/mutase family protein [Planctomycetales bacterium]